MLLLPSCGKVLLCLLSIVPQLHFKQDHVHCFPGAGDYSVLYDAVFNHTRGHDRQGTILRGKRVARTLILAMSFDCHIFLSLEFGVSVSFSFPRNLISSTEFKGFFKSFFLRSRVLLGRIFREELMKVISVFVVMMLEHQPTTNASHVQFLAGDLILVP